MIEPFPGRIVWFWRNGRPVGFDPNNPCASSGYGDQPAPAMITHVFSDRCVNLAVFEPTGGTSSETSVELWQGDGEPPAWRHCEWKMPYQKGQAAKTEALVEQAKNSLTAAIG